MFRSRFAYDDDKNHINPRDHIEINWEKINRDNGIVPKPGNAWANYEPLAAATAEPKSESA